MKRIEITLDEVHEMFCHLQDKCEIWPFIFTAKMWTRYIKENIFYKFIYDADNKTFCGFCDSLKKYDLVII